MNEANNRILWVVLTTNDFKHNEVLPELMNQIDPKNVLRVTGDGAYDDKKCLSMSKDSVEFKEEHPLSKLSVVHFAS